METVIVECISSKEIFCEFNSCVSHHLTSENQCTWLGSVTNRTIK